MKVNLRAVAARHAAMLRSIRYPVVVESARCNRCGHDVNPADIRPGVVCAGCTGEKVARCTGCEHVTDPAELRASDMVCTGCTGERRRDRRSGMWLS